MSDVRIELLKAVKTAVNTASFAPTTDRIEDAKREVMRLLDFINSMETPKPKRRRKTKQKAGKATPSTKVADRQEKAFHGKADTPVTPSARKPKASVEAARKAAQDVSRHTGAAKRAEQKAKKVRKAVVMPKAAPMKVTPAQLPTYDDQVARMEAKLERIMTEHKRLVDTLADMMASDVTPTANEVCFSDLPFDPTTNL